MEGTYQLLQIPRSKSCHDQNQSSFLLLSVLYCCGSSPYTLIKVIFPLSLDQFPSTIKINSQSLCLPQSKSIPLTLTYIFKCLPWTSSTIQPTAALYELICFTRANRINPHSHVQDQFPHPSLTLFPSLTQEFCLVPFSSSDLLPAHPFQFYSSFSLSHSLLQTGSNPSTHSLLPSLHLTPLGSLAPNSFPVQQWCKKFA